MASTSADSSGAGGQLVVADVVVHARSPWELFWRRLRQDKLALASLGFIVFLILVAFGAPLLVKLFGVPGPNVQQSSALDSFGTATGPSGSHPLGVDQLGRDVLSRTLYGARVSLEVAFIATGIALVFGTAIGLVAGYYRGWTDSILSRAVDVLLAFPVLLLALGIASACSVSGCFGGTVKPGIGTVIFVIAFINWTYFARIIRGQVLSLREKEFVEAARSVGASNFRIMTRELLPNLVAPIIVYATLIIPINILLEAALSFLGVGIQQPTASWGAMIADASNTYDTTWWYMLFPGLALLSTVMAFNLLGDGLQDALNPRRGK